MELTLIARVDIVAATGNGFGSMSRYVSSTSSHRS